MVTPKPRLFGYISECSVAVVAVEDILPVSRAEDIVKSVIVVVADADTAGPPNRVQTCFFRDVGKCAVAVVFVESICGAFGRSSKASAGKHQQIHPPIVVVIQE